MTIKTQCFFVFFQLQLSGLIGYIWGTESIATALFGSWKYFCTSNHLYQLDGVNPHCQGDNGQWIIPDCTKPMQLPRNLYLCVCLHFCLASNDADCKQPQARGWECKQSKLEVTKSWSCKLLACKSSEHLKTRESLFTGLDYWTGLLDWTTGLAQNGVKCLFKPFSV